MTGPRRLGGYELVDRLAVGGMAEIYIARARSIQGFEKEYVLKLIHPKHSGDDEFMRMLVDEAKLTAQLQHINIAQVIDLGRHDDNYFIVMEYVRGKDLYQILNRAYDEDVQIPLEVCAFIAREIAAGLQYAHTTNDTFTGRPLNLVHRDISPQNILVSWLGEVKIVDFGVAKAALAARPETQAGVIKGKFRYMSPEQAWGEKLDGRSDIFSAGLCLYEMVTSSMAYDDEPDMRQMLVQMREARFTPPSELRPDVDPELEAIIMKALKRRRHERFGTAEEFESALNQYLAQKAPGFTRRIVRSFFAQIYPEEIPYDAPPVIRAKKLDVITEPVVVADDTGKETKPMNKTVSDDELGPSDQTVPNQIPSMSPDSSFEAEATELWSHANDTAETEPLSTASMSDDDIRAILTRAHGLNSSGEFNTTDERKPAQKNPPAPIPSAWMPKEVPEAPAARTEFRPGATAPPGSQAPNFQPAPQSNSPDPRQILKSILEDDDKKKLAIAVSVVFAAVLLFAVFLGLAI